MADVYGTVQRLTSRKAGRGYAHNVQMDDGQWYGHGFKQPNFGEGAEISFDVEYNGQYANIIVESVQVMSPGQPAQQQQGGNNWQGNGNYRSNNGGGQRSSANRTKSMGGLSKDDYWKNREKRDIIVQKQIQYQSARNSAIEVIKAGIDAGAISLPAAKAKAFDALRALVDEVTDEYNEATTAIGAPKQRAQQQQQQAPQQDAGEADGFDDDIPF